MKDNKSKHSTSILIVLGISILAIGLASLFIKRHCCTNSDWLSIFGSIASILGLSITCYELFNVKEVTEQTQNAVNNNIFSVNKFITFSNTSTAVDIIDKVELALQNQRHETTLIYLKQLKEFLIDIQYNDKVSSIIPDELKEIPAYVVRITTDIKSLNSFLSSNQSIDCNIISKHIEDLKTLLSGINSKIKYTEL